MRPILGATQSLGSPDLGFFKPYASGKDFFNRITAIGTAPIGFTLMSIHHFFIAAESLAYSALYLIALDPKHASTCFTKTFEFIFEAIKDLLKAIISPVINAVDFVVSAGTTLTR